MIRIRDIILRWIVPASVFLFIILMIPGEADAERKTPVVSDMTSARELCDTRPMHPIEGIWRFPDDHINVLILLDSRTGPTQPATYSVYVVESEDTRLHTGDLAGKVTETPDPNKFRLSLFTKRIGGVLAVPCDGVATLRNDAESIVIKTPKIKVKINPMAFFSNFWRIARISVDNPLTSLPAGLIKIYPTYDGNGSMTRYPRYL